jgi:hypothetical protein
MKKLILTMLTVAAMAVAAHASGLSRNWKIQCNKGDSSSVRRAAEGNPILIQTIQAAGLSLQTKTAFTAQGKTLLRGVLVESPIGPIELLYFFDRN